MPNATFAELQQISLWVAAEDNPLFSCLQTLCLHSLRGSDVHLTMWNQDERMFYFRVVAQMVVLLGNIETSSIMTSTQHFIR